MNKVLSSLGFKKYDELNGFYSEHLIIFTALAKSNHKIKNILEIGTHNARTTCILSKLFPNAQITTVDLEDDNPIFKKTYKRNKNLNRFIKKRNNLLSKHKNINFIQFNSLNLSIVNDKISKQDLIWVDGAHGYPIVSADITNSIRFMNRQGVLMCDDIWKKTKKNDDMYVSQVVMKPFHLLVKPKLLKLSIFAKE